MGSGAIVFLPDGYPGPGNPAASFIASEFLGTCAMWHGFECGTDTYIYSFESQFGDAEYTFTLPECASIFQFYKSQFSRNFIGIYKPHINNSFYFRSTLPDPSIFQSTLFSGVQPITLPPYPNQAGVPFNNASFAGMYYHDLIKPTIGQYSIPFSTTLSYNGCTFDHLSFGVMGFNSIIDVHNCKFTDIQNWGAYNYKDNLAAAIYSSVSGGMPTKSMEVGEISGTDFLENDYTDCYVGIWGIGNIDSYIAYNHMIHTSPSSPLEYAAGVRLLNSSNTTIRIHDNDITDNYVFTNAAPYYSTAIAVSNSTIYYQDLQISNNLINDNRYGIYLNNIKAPDKDTRFLVDWNVINSTTSHPDLDPGQYVGISLNHVYVGDVLNNVMNRTVSLPSDPSFQTHMYGIVNNDSRDLNIDRNLIEHYGTGMDFIGNCFASFLHCNDLFECMQGMFLTSVVMSDQGSFTDPWDNLWDGFPTTLGVFNRMDGTGTPFNWAHRGAPNPPSNIYSFSPNVTFVIPISYATSSSSYCPTGGDERSLLTKIVSDSLQFESNAYEQSYLAKQLAYNVLKENDSLMNSDIIYFDFISNNENTNYQYYNDVDQLINQDQKQDALNLLNLISDTNRIETNKSFTAKLSLQVDLDPNYVISSADSSMLYQIAYTNVWEGGDGVFTARHLLGLQIIDFENSTVRVRRNYSKNTTSEFSFYPNPSTGHLSFSANTMSKFDHIQIMDMAGLIVYSGKLNSSMNVSFLETGIYTISFFKQSEVVKVEKLIVSHQ